MTVKNINNISCLKLLNLTKKFQKGWASCRNVTLCSTLRKPTIKKYDKPYHTSNVDKKSPISMIKEEGTLKNFCIDRRQFENAYANERLHLCNQILKDQYLKKREQQALFDNRNKVQLPLSTKKLKDIKTQIRESIETGCNIRLHNLDAPTRFFDTDGYDSLVDHRYRNSTYIERWHMKVPKRMSPAVAREQAIRSSRRTLSYENIPPENLLPSNSTGDEHYGKITDDNKVWLIGARKIPCIE